MWKFFLDNRHVPQDDIRVAKAPPVCAFANQLWEKSPCQWLQVANLVEPAASKASNIRFGILEHDGEETISAAG